MEQWSLATEKHPPPQNHIFLERSHSGEFKMGTHIFLLQITESQCFPKIDGCDIPENCTKPFTFKHLISHIALGTKKTHPKYESQGSTKQFDAHCAYAHQMITKVSGIYRP